jgi:hypothetical protein
VAAEERQVLVVDVPEGGAEFFGSGRVHATAP